MMGFRLLFVFFYLIPGLFNKLDLSMEIFELLLKGKNVLSVTLLHEICRGCTKKKDEEKERNVI